MNAILRTLAAIFFVALVIYLKYTVARQAEARKNQKADIQSLFDGEK